MRKCRTQVELKISTFFTETNQPGVKYNGSTIILENKEKRKYISKKTKEEKALSVLNKYNIGNSLKIYLELHESMKGIPTSVKKIKITKIPDM